MRRQHIAKPRPLQEHAVSDRLAYVELVGKGDGALSYLFAPVTRTVTV